MMDNKFDPNILSPEPHLILINHIKMKTLLTKPWALIELTSQILLSLPAHHSQAEENFRTKETFSVCLFIPVLALYLFTPVTHLFFPLSTSLSPAACSHTQAVWWRCSSREKDLGDHLKPIMAALQPPRNSVTDGDLVFIAGVIGNTQTHTHTHTRNTHTHTTQGSTKK